MVVHGRTDPAGPVLPAVDGSTAGEAAIGFAFAEAALRGAPLVAVRVWNTGSEHAYEGPGGPLTAVVAGAEWLRQAERRLRDDAIAVHHHATPRLTPCHLGRWPSRSLRYGSLLGPVETFEEETETFLAGSIDDPPSIAQSSVSEKAVASSKFRSTGPLGHLCSTTDPRTTAPAPPRSRSGEVRASASWLFAQSERCATPHGGPPAEPRWSSPCLCRNTAAAGVGADDAFRCTSVLP
ncbi:universal stress protein [Streptomyces sp. NPDC019990]|uniref:universal stress protein n=1 Tax=Streptomyces sp. NPDC019990 TaxID=3154693 RepID=UPI0033E8EEF0